MKLFRNLIPSMALAFVVTAASVSSLAEEQNLPYNDQEAMSYLDEVTEMSDVENYSIDNSNDTSHIRRPPRYRPRPRPRYTCYAVNGRGQYFRGRANDRVTAAKRAIESCARVSRRCQFAGCQ